MFKSIPFIAKHVFLIFGLVFLTGSALAQQLDVPVMERADGDLDTCAYGQIVGLKSDGDGFLAVRSGPATSFEKIDELHNGDDVWLYEQQGDWIGVAYGLAEVNCSPIKADRLLPLEGNMGWVHQNWVELMAG